MTVAKSYRNACSQKALYAIDIGIKFASRLRKIIRFYLGRYRKDATGIRSGKGRKPSKRAQNIRIFRYNRQNSGFVALDDNELIVKRKLIFKKENSKNIRKSAIINDFVGKAPLSEKLAFFTLEDYKTKK